MLNCFICDASYESSNLIERPYPKGAITKGPNKILDCPTCNVGRAEPFPSEQELENLVDWSYFWPNKEIEKIRYENYPSAAGLGLIRLNSVLNKLSSDLQNIRVLDVGAGQGFFGIEAAKKLKNRLSQYTVVEFDPKMREGIAEAWDHYDLTGQYSCFEKLEDVNEMFNIIVLSHILEHVRDPRDFITKCLKYLKKDGVIFIDVPHTDYRFKSNTYLHLYFFTPTILSELVNSFKGITVLQSKSWGRYHNSTLVGKLLAKVYNQLFRVTYKIKRFLPITYSIKIYNYLYGSDLENPEGTWVRLIAQKN